MNEKILELILISANCHLRNMGASMAQLVRGCTMVLLSSMVTITSTNTITIITTTTIIIVIATIINKSPGAHRYQLARPPLPLLLPRDRLRHRRPLRLQVRPRDSRQDSAPTLLHLLEQVGEYKDRKIQTHKFTKTFL